MAIQTADGGQEKLIVDRRSIIDGMIDIGFPVGSEAGRYLIELPRETLRGSWRVWIPADALVREIAA